ncbi:MAG: DUF4129 domain-containing protein [Acidimicrobiales bacterium]
MPELREGPARPGRTVSAPVASGVPVLAAGAALGAAAAVAAAGRAVAELERSERDPDEVGRLADDVLARAEFQPREPSIVDRALEWLGERLAELFGQLFGAGGGTSSVGVALMVVGAVVAAVFLARNLRYAPRRRPDDDDDEPWLAVDEVHDAAGWDDAAVAAEAAGDWRQGLRCRFGALTTRLGDRGLLPPEPGRTTGEHRVDVRRSLPAAAEDFALAAELFDRAWYGGLPTGPDEAARFAAAAAAVLAVEPAPDRRPVGVGAAPVAAP